LHLFATVTPPEFLAGGKLTHFEAAARADEGREIHRKETKSAKRDKQPA
jgi:hypothetical protein